MAKSGRRRRPVPDGGTASDHAPAGLRARGSMSGDLLQNVKERKLSLQYCSLIQFFRCECKNDYDDAKRVD